MITRNPATQTVKMTGGTPNKAPNSHAPQISSGVNLKREEQKRAAGNRRVFKR
jgi:hypothetical protein